jgi:hypothetical protein
MKIEVPISVGEFLDRLSILEIKQENGLNVSSEISKYAKDREKLSQSIGYEYYFGIIRAINSSLWNLEDTKRKNVTRYTLLYSDVATLITQINDLRFQTKKKIDEYFESEISEQKSHDF